MKQPIGKLVIPISLLQEHTKDIEEWYPLSAPNSTSVMTEAQLLQGAQQFPSDMPPLGSVRIKVRYLEDVILPPLAYASFYQVFVSVFNFSCCHERIFEPFNSCPN